MATKYESTTDPAVAPLRVSMTFHAGTVPAADGTDGAVALLIRYAKMTIRSPTLWLGSVTVVEFDIAEPVIAKDMDQPPAAAPKRETTAPPIFSC